MSKRLDRSELEARRIEAGKLLQRGVRPAEVARRLKVSRYAHGATVNTVRGISIVQAAVDMPNG